MVTGGRGGGAGGVAARERLLRAAGEVFYRGGLGATGIDAVTRAAGVAKMSLYNNFASKDDLVLGYLQARHEEWLGLHRRRAAVAGTPRGRVLAVAQAYLDHALLAPADGFRGCGLLNAGAELPAGSPGRELVRRHKEQVEALLEDALHDMVLRPGATAPGVAEHLALVLEGAMVRSGLEGDVDRLRRACDLVAGVLDGVTEQATR